MEWIEELYSEHLKERHGHVRENSFYEIAVTLEVEQAEVRMNDVHRDRSLQHLALNIMIGNRGAKAKVDYLQVGHE